MGLFDRLQGNNNPRVAFIGIDGVPYSLIENHPEEFPNLTAIAEEGTGSAIDSIVPPESSACWPSLTTGVNPGETGVYGFQDRETGSYDTYVPMGRDVQAPRLWDRVTEAGRDATVMNVPVTFPPQRNVQRMVSGFLSPGLDRAATPDAFREHLEADEYIIDTNARLGHEDDKTEFIDHANRTLERRHATFMNYLTTDDWDLFFGVFMTTDRVNHFLFEHYDKDGQYREEFLDFYRTLDGYIGEIREVIPDDVTLMVASDHGFTTLEYEVNCNEWLRRNGWLEYEDEPQELGDITSDTRAYSLIPGRVYLNLEDREPNGSVPQDEYETVRDELKADLETMEAPDGQQVARRVVKKEDAFDGDHADIAPDLVIIPENGYDLKSGFSRKDEVFTSGPRNGMHSFENTSLFIDTDEASIGDADLLDIAPTILDFLEIDRDASEFDGQSLV